ncbi:MAG TPA: hypothetical protein VEJ44_03095 [Acidimicrobiales bacterium]|nr:hypothetical protein [Acidimicrobiales bacterium]
MDAARAGRPGSEREVRVPDAIASPKVPGLEPTFRHLDDPDVPWQRVRSVRRSDGTVASVWEKWLAFSPDPLYLSLYARWDPGVIQRRHGHLSPHVLMVLEGEMRCGDEPCPAGTHIELPLGAAFGPFVAGPDGAVLFEVMMGDPRGWGDDPESFHRLLEAHGAEALPDPPIELPAWLEDLRGRWTAEPAESVE